MNSQNDMDTPVSYRKAFVRSPHHAWLGALTIGVGFAFGHILGLIAGTAAYCLGWVYLPDLRFFKQWVDSNNKSALARDEEKELAQFLERRGRMLSNLGESQRARYSTLGGICAEIESAGSGESASSAGPLNDPQLRRLDDLMWTYLKMLSIEESIVHFLKSEEAENLPDLLKETEMELVEIAGQLRETLSDSVRETRKRLEQSKLDRLQVLTKRMEKTEQARANLDLVRAEEDRLEHQIKLARAEAVASRNTANLSTRINSTVEQLDHTNRWISEMEEFKDLVGDLPNSGLRIGYKAEATSVGSSPNSGPAPRRLPASGRS